MDLIERRTDFSWQTADPFDTQSTEYTEVPTVPGLYVWMRRRQPGPFPEQSDEVLFVGSSKNLRRRLHSFSSGTAVADTTLQRLFDLVIAPAVTPERLQAVVTARRAMPITQMWVRDHVVFRYAPLARISDNFAIVHTGGFFDLSSDEKPPQGANARLKWAEETAIQLLGPTFNSNERWWAKGPTWHEDHDITLPITPRFAGEITQRADGSHRP